MHPLPGDARVVSRCWQAECQILSPLGKGGLGGGVAASRRKPKPAGSSVRAFCNFHRSTSPLQPPSVPPSKGGKENESRAGCASLRSTSPLQPPSVPPSKGGKEDRGLRTRLDIWLPNRVWAGVCLALLTLFFSGGCATKPTPEPVVADPAEPPELLSSYGLFHGNGASQQPVAGVVPYEVNTPLFSDYAHKLRFVKLPAGASAELRYSARSISRSGRS